MNQFLQNCTLGIILCFSLFIASCGSSDKDIPDVSDIPVAFDLLRTEEIIAKLDTNTTNILAPLYKVDSSFFEIYFERLLQVPIFQMSVEQQDNFIKGFIRDSRIRRIMHEVDSIYGDFFEIEDALAESFQYAKYYFPEKATPNIYTYISEFTYQRFIFNNGQQDGIALGLDMFLGENYPYAKYVPNNTFFSQYLVRRYTKDYIVRNTAETLAEDWLGVPRGETLLDMMIYHGKKLYITQKLIPHESEAKVMGYTDEQLQWCADNEQEMWSYLFKENLFYSTDMNKIKKLVTPSPHSTGMPPEAPGRTANYLGWKIIEAFMARNGFEPQEILSLNTFSSQEILEMSKFKPKRK